MARERTEQEILDQVVYAIAAVNFHYGNEFSPEGLKELRRLLSDFTTWHCDTEWRVDLYEEDYPEGVDFCPKVLNEGNTGLNFDEVAMESR